MGKKPIEPMKLSDLAEVDHKMQGHIVHAFAIGRGFQYSPRHSEDVKNNTQIYDAYLQAPGSSWQVIKVQGSHSVTDCAEVCN